MLASPPLPVKFPIFRLVREISAGGFPASYLQRRYCSPSFRQVLLLPAGSYRRRCAVAIRPTATTTQGGSFLLSFSSFRTSFRFTP